MASSTSSAVTDGKDLETTPPQPATHHNSKNNNNTTTTKETEAAATAPAGDSASSGGSDGVNEKETAPANGTPPNNDEAAAAAAAAAVGKGEAAPIPPEQQRTSLQTALIMASLMIAVFLAALDITIVTTALPSIAAHFHASQGNYTWIGSAYTLAAAAAVPAWGKFSDIWGRKVILLLANFVFFIGSLIAALSINIQMLLAGRVIQGMAAGGLIVLANICISDLFSQRERGKYFGLIGGVWGFASALGPIIGGALSENVTWRWCFYINLPFDGLAFMIILFFFSVEIPKTDLLDGLKAIDWLGIVLISCGTVMFLLGLEYGGVNYPWDSATVICLIVFGLVVIGLFFVNEWKLAKYPVMPLRLFRHPTSIACFSVCFLHGSVFICGVYFLPLYYQSVLGATPILSGVYLLPFVLLLSVTSMVVGVFIKKTGNYLGPIWVGVVLMTIGFGLFIDLPNDRSWGRIFGFQVIAGIGVGPLFQAPLIALQTNIPPRDIATVTSLFGFIRNLSTSISVIIGGVIFQNRMLKHRAQLDSVLHNDALAGYLSSGAAGAATKTVDALPPVARTTVRDAYTDSLRDIWIYAVALAAVAVAVTPFIRRRELSKEHHEYKAGLEQEKINRLARLESETRHKAEKTMKKARKEEKHGKKTGADGVTGDDNAV